MHPRNPYSTNGIDFTSLALKSPAFAKHLSAGQHIDFKDPEALRALNEATLEYDWGLYVNQPADRLCPPIPNRLDYLLWVQDVLRETVEIDGGRYGIEGGEKEERPKKRVKRGSRSSEDEDEDDVTPSHPHILDIGTGATAIYPILGCALDPSWTFAATDIDVDSLRNAQRILDDPRNNGDPAERQPTVLGSHATWPLNLVRRITLQQRDPSEDLIPASTTLFSITMCNPPFYTNQDEMDSAAAAKHLPPRGACVGTANEIFYAEGGEVGFVGRMIEQSSREPGRARWYSSLLGKASSLPAIHAALKKHGVSNYGFTSFAQGQTRRWAVVWSHGYHRLPDELVRLKSLPSGVGQGMMPPSSTITKEMPGGREEAREKLRGVREFVRGLRGMVVEGAEEGNEEKEELSVRFETPSWTRAARRAAAREKDGEAGQAGANSSASTPAGAEPILCLLIGIEDGDGNDKDHSAEAGNGACQLRLQWTYGKDRTHFESFASTVLRRLSNGDGNGQEKR